MTLAKIGRSMKKRENMRSLSGGGRIRRSLRCGLLFRSDFFAGPGPLQSLDDESLVPFEPLFDDPLISDLLSSRHFAALDRVVLPHDEQVSPGLIGSNGFVGDDHALLILAHGHAETYGETGRKVVRGGFLNVPRTRIVPLLGSTVLSKKSIVP